jgi:hypothetical protein
MPTNLLVSSFAYYIYSAVVYIYLILTWINWLLCTYSFSELVICCASCLFFHFEMGPAGEYLTDPLLIIVLVIV